VNTHVQHAVAVVAASLAITIGWMGSRVIGQSPATALADAYQQDAYPVLAANCVSCHSDRMQTANLSFEGVKDPAFAIQQTALWQKVFDKVSEGQMPPNKPMAASDLERLTGWIKKLPGITTEAASVEESGAPIPVTARRLNRAEYNNTIRDLLGVTIKPADVFPIDDAGYGFDNIGDVLTMSPMLMEKYLAAARIVARTAVFGEVYPDKPSLLVTLLPKKIQDNVPARGNETGYAFRGTLFAKYHFPVDGEYEFRWRYTNFRGRGGPAGPRVKRPAATGAADGGDQDDPAAAPARAGRGGGGQGRGGGGRGRGPLTEEQRQAALEARLKAFPPVPVVLTIDGGSPVVTDYVEGDATYKLEHGDSVGMVRVTAGDHELRISWPHLADHPDPFGLLIADGRQQLITDYLKITGPFRPSTERPASYKKIFTCGTPGNYSKACVQQIVTNLITGAYRRPATAQEVKDAVNLVEEVRKRDIVEQGVRMVIESVLISPKFLFRIEQPAVPATKPRAAHALTDYQLASRLSYFLWSSMPDAELFRVAGEGRMHDPVVLQAQIDRMLQDPKAIALVDNFGEQWLNLRVMDRVKPDRDAFIFIDDEILHYMRQETRLFLQDVFRENRSILDFIDGKYTFLNGPLATYYGIKDVKGEKFQRIEVDGEQRSGIITQGSVLVTSSYATRTSPVLRGRWVLDTLLGTPPPPPPPDIPPLEEKDLGTAASLRVRLEQHRANPRCAVCHDRMDAIGFALENYDAAGAWRAKDGNFDIDANGNLPDGRLVKGANGLKKILRDDSQVFAKNFAEKLMTFALGRGLEKSDAPAVAHILADTKPQDYRFAALVSSIVKSRPFLMEGSGGVQ
jgi:cytochrome c553